MFEPAFRVTLICGGQKCYSKRPGFESQQFLVKLCSLRHSVHPLICKVGTLAYILPGLLGCE